MENKKLFDQVVENINKDNEVKSAYKSFYIKRAVTYTIISGLYAGFFFIIHATCRPSTLQGFMFGTIFIDIPMVFMMLIGLKGNKFVLMNGCTYHSALGILMKCVCYFDAMVPMMKLVAYFNYDFQAGTLDTPIWKLIVLAPVAFVIITLVGAFMNTKGVYSEGNSMTKMDWINMRNEQEIAGIDPDKMPITLSPEQIKSMSKNDWFMLGQDLELAGYDVFKK